MNKRRLFFLVGILVSASLFAACKRELSQEQVEASQYYIDLQKKYENLEIKNEKLNEQLAQANDISPEEKEIKTLLDKIGRDSLFKMEIAYADSSEGALFVESKGVLSMANKLAVNSDWITRYSLEELQKNFDAVYSYVLYDEDNSVFELEIYEGDFLVFKDLPDKVFYAQGANKFGDAYLARKQYYPSITLLGAMAESSLVVRGSKAFDRNTAYEFVIYLDRVEKKRIKEENANDEMKAPYLFHNHSEVIEVEFGTNTLHIKGMDKDLWYRVDKEQIKEMKKIFTEK